MKRREMMVASASALAGLYCGGAMARGLSEDVEEPGGQIAPLSGQCRFLPIEVHQRVAPGELTSIRLLHFWPDQTASAQRLSRWDVDLTVLDARGISRVIHAWQLRRSGLNPDNAGGRVCMNFPDGAELGARTLTQRGPRGTVVSWGEAMPSPGLVVLASARSNTGVPPLLQDLRYLSKGPELTLANGELRDFDALLIQIS